MRTSAALAFSCAAALAAFVACGTSGSGFSDDKGSSGGNNADAQGPGQFGSSDASASDVIPPPLGIVKGKVTAPEGTIPISEALIYLTKTPPAPIPTSTYCDKCVELTSYAFTYSKPDGTFELPAYLEGEQYMVTQKGQFRRVRKVIITKGTQGSNGDDTRLPGKNDEAAGDTIPRMKVMQATWDSIAKSLKKLGITEFTEKTGGIFDIDHTLDDITEATKYHIIFIPCSGGADFSQDIKCTNPYAPSSKSKNVTKDYVQQGGKLYVTDWSYEYVRQIWPGFISFAGADSRIGSACGGEYSGPAVWGDPSLNAWMTAIGETSAELKKSYTVISSTAPQPGQDENGNSVTITPKTWASTKAGGGTLPSTVSFQDKCGRVMYSTYHAEGTDNGGSNTLLAQEKALFHILLEVSACVGVKPTVPR